MPWWVITYLVALTLMITIALIKDYKDQRGALYMLAEFASGAIGFVFVYAWFNPELATIIGWLTLPFLAYAIIWDQIALRQMKKSAYADLSESENQDMDKYSKLFAILFISPCYVSGGLISWQLISA
jgi:hypothetical protein